MMNDYRKFVETFLGKEHLGECRKESGKMTNKNARHYIADESIGGIEREYVEVERKADVGDYVINNKGNDAEEIYRVTGFKNAWALPSYTVEYNEDDWESTVAVSIDRSITLEPTDIVRIDGERYRLVDRHAEVGEKVLIIGIHGEHEGDTGVVEYSYNDGSISINIGDGFGYFPYAFGGEYRVLESLKPVEVEPLTVDETQASPQVIGMLANLARRVTQLEAQLRDTQRNVETFAEQTESNSEDIRLLDERTQVPSKKFNLSDLDGKELSVYSATDSAEGITVITTVGIDERDEKMYVLESRVLAND